MTVHNNQHNKINTNNNRNEAKLHRSKVQPLKMSCERGGFVPHLVMFVLFVLFLFVVAVLLLNALLDSQLLP